MGVKLELGVCLDALNPAGCPDPAAYPFGWARLVAFDDPRFYAYAAQLDRAGVRLAYVLARESFGAGESSSPAGETDYAAVTHQIALRAPWPALWVVGNEMDAPPGSAASWSMDVTEYGALWHACAGAIRRIGPLATVVVGGMVSGQVDAARRYVAAARATGIAPSGVDVHPYGGTATGTAAFLLTIHEATQTACYVLEWIRPPDEIAAFVGMLMTVGVPLATWFCWSDAMVDGFGLRDAAGAAKPEHDVLVAIASRTPSSQDTETGQETQCGADGGVMASETDRLIAARAADVGTVYERGTGALPAASAWACTDGGVTLEAPGVPGAYLLVDVTLLDARVAALQAQIDELRKLASFPRATA
ncbi:MAG: hypothetical protein QOF51_1791 [Chloroflexota bacterium]|jgi:hypothetical protein|nr:hypothetical protein [Chloroflexota bacterium]